LDSENNCWRRPDLRQRGLVLGLAGDRQKDKVGGGVLRARGELCRVRKGTNIVALPLASGFLVGCASYERVRRKGEGNGKGGKNGEGGGKVFHLSLHRDAVPKGGDERR